MSEKIKFESNIDHEAEKAPFRRMIEKEQEEIAKLKTGPARWVGLAARNLSESAIED
ncbi:MAG: hypothetical protein P1P90_01870 [Patescibacteria group bacterium]|nr:hypothetical protein [Patescibacteria group bacterium]